MTQPNILILYTDQQRHDTIHALGNPVIQTPNLDRLCTAGTAFTQATTPAPVCMPARWSLHSGQWTTTHRCYSNHHEGSRPAVVLPTRLRQAGYRTGLVGKNHSFLTPDDLDYWDTNPPAADAGAAAERAAWMQTGRERWPRLAEEPVPGGVAADPEQAKTDAALGFLKDCGDQPFFLWLSYHNPHTPYYAPEPYFSLYTDARLPACMCEPEGLAAAGKPYRQQFHQRNNDAVLPFTPEQIDAMRRVYYGMISLTDAEIGRVLDHLDHAGLRENTLVFFTSDHGDYQGDHGLLTKSPALYDCLVRIPFIVSQPGTIPTGVRSDALANAVDIMPTCLAAAGLPCPDTVQGRDLLPLLHGRTASIRDVVFSEYGIPEGPPCREAELQGGERFVNPGRDDLPWEGNPLALAGRIRMARTREWKLIEEIGGTNELYDLIHDPNELVNLYGHPDRSAIQKQLTAALQEWKTQLPGFEG